MTRKLCGLAAVCAVSLALAAQAQSSSSENNNSPNTVGGVYNGQNRSQMGWNRNLSATGRMGHQDVKASQLTGAPVTGSSGETLGNISDCIVNPASGRVEFAIISLNNLGTTSSTPSTPSTSGTLNSNAGRMVAVPWILLRPSNLNNQAGSTASTTSSTTSPQSFTYSGDSSKLASAPRFDPNASLSEPSWHNRVDSYFGVGSATGGAESPYGSSSGANQNQKNPSSNPGTP